MVDPRTLRPLDEDIDLRVGAQDRTAAWWSRRAGAIAGFGAEIADRVQRECFDDLDAPVLRVTAADVPMPYAKTLEKAYLPQPDSIVAAVKRIVER